MPDSRKAERAFNKKMQRRITYRVDVITSSGTYAEYTSSNGVDKAFAESLAAYLKTRGQGGRLVRLPSGKIVETWPLTGTLASPTEYQDLAQAYRDAHPNPVVLEENTL
jgi:hypothetical protein